MEKITLKGNPVSTIGNLPAEGEKAPDFTGVKTDLSEVSLSDYKGKKVVLNIFPSVGTGVCAASVRKFNEKAQELENTVVLCVSMDLPFAHASFCGAEGLNDVIPISVFRSPEFGESYGVTILDGIFKGLMSRSVIVVNEEGKVVYTQQVPEISDEPDYESALAAL
ncbi:MAG: thiol peroxidase [Bacteroidales bacterium]